MSGRARRFGVALAALMLAVVLSVPAPAAAGPAVAAAAPPALLDSVDSNASAADQGMRLDRSARVFEMTGYQTLAVAGLVAGAAIAGGLSGGASGAIVGGTAVFLLYLFMP